MGLLYHTSIMDNLTEKKVEHEMETEITQGYIGFRVEGVG